MPPISKHLLSDLVCDSKLEATVSDAGTVHITYRYSRSTRRRRVPTEERWVRDGCLGRGAYGTVYKEKCEQGSQIKLRAVKEIKKSVVTGEEIDYTRELEAVAKFSHARYSDWFVRSDGWFESGDSVFISMEYLERGDLQRYLARPLPEIEAREITSQVLEGLKRMHDNRFIHRDLKPGNIMVVEEGPDWWVKIADFGISKRRHDITTLQTLQRGTMGFAAPEAVGVSDSADGPYSSAVDIWSLGAVAFLMLTGQSAFRNFAELAGYCSGTRKFPAETMQKFAVSGEAQDFVASLMLLEPEARPPADKALQHLWMKTVISTAHIVGAAATTGTMPIGDNKLMAANATIVSEASASWSDEDEAEGTVVPNQTITRMQCTVEEEKDETSTDGQPRHEPRGDNYKADVTPPTRRTADRRQLPRVIADREIGGPDSRPGAKQGHFPSDHSKGKSKLAGYYGVRASTDIEPPPYHLPRRLPRNEELRERFKLRDERDNNLSKGRPTPTVHQFYTAPPIVPGFPPRVGVPRSNITSQEYRSSIPNRLPAFTRTQTWSLTPDDKDVDEYSDDEHGRHYYRQTSCRGSPGPRPAYKVEGPKTIKVSYAVTLGDMKSSDASGEDSDNGPGRHHHRQTSYRTSPGPRPAYKVEGPKTIQVSNAATPVM